MTETQAMLTPGDPAPRFRQRSSVNPSYAFDTAAGRYVVLCFLGSAGDAHAEAALALIRNRPGFFDDTEACAFAVSIDPKDEEAGRHIASGRVRFFWDFGLTASRAYGAVPGDATLPGEVRYRRMWVVIDPMLRVLNVVPFRQDQGDLDEVAAILDGLPPKQTFAGFELYAPVLILPRVFEPELCGALVDLYRAEGGEDSGFMREVEGKTVGLIDHRHKRRRDCLIRDEGLRAATRARVLRRIVPEIARVHHFTATRMERYIVAHYAGEDGGHFAPHRDNTTSGTAHRRFAVTVNLNDGYDGGEVVFPEYSERGYRPPLGGALVFSCSLQHGARKVTRGDRYAFLPFLYDDAAAKIREQNNAKLGEGVGRYGGGPASGKDTDAGRAMPPRDG